MTFHRADLPVVLDASVAVQAAIGAGHDSGTVAAWVASGRLILVPEHFWLEVANALLGRQRVPIDAVRSRIGRLRAAGVSGVAAIPRRLDEAIGLGRENQISVYDGLYLQVAIETDGSLATHDKALARAADAEGVVLEPLD